MLDCPGATEGAMAGEDGGAVGGAIAGPQFLACPIGSDEDQPLAQGYRLPRARPARVPLGGGDHCRAARCAVRRPKLLTVGAIVGGEVEHAIDGGQPGRLGPRPGRG